MTAGIAALVAVVSGSLMAPDALAARKTYRPPKHPDFTIQATLSPNEWGGSYGTWSSEGAITDSGWCSTGGDPWDLPLDGPYTTAWRFYGATWTIHIIQVGDGTAIFDASRDGLAEPIRGYATYTVNTWWDNGQIVSQDYTFSACITPSA